MVGLNAIPTLILDTVSEFYVCSGCGKCYWIGSHYRKFLEGRSKLPLQNPDKEIDSGIAGAAATRTDDTANCNVSHKTS
jgi:hypothetical protein